MAKKSPLKLSAQKPLIVFLRLYGAPKKRTLALCKKYGRGHNDLALAGLMAEVARLERHAPALSPALAGVLGELEALHIDPTPHLQALIADAASAA